MRIRRRAFMGAAVVGPAAALMSACATRSNDPHVITFWTSDSSPTRLAALKRIVAGFEKENPGYHVQVVPKPALGVGDATSLITAVRGRTAPDVYLIDRFGTAQYAAIGLLTDLQPFVQQDPGLASKYLGFAWKEATYRDHLYALPVDTATNAVLYYNTDMLKTAGIDPDVLDPRHGPPTVEQVIDIALKMNRKNSAGNYTQMGMIPWSGQGFWCAWAMMNGAKFYDQKTCTITATEPALMKTLTEFQHWAKEMNYSRTDAFSATYQPPGSPPQQSLFYTSKVGMQIDGNWGKQNLKLYAPKMKYGVTYFPVQQKGDPPFSWSGGFALAVPRYAVNPDGGWKFMKYATGPVGQRIATEETGLLPAYKPLLNDRTLIGDQEFFANLLKKYTQSRPPLPVMGQYSNVLDQAQSAVLLGDSTPRQALEQVHDQLQGAMDQYCPFQLP
ncbi:MAG TPA: ABC transporter substrate-binding protein [Mycobacteriales bacterium]|nr:ABC transporter substrate-binding protein [Mycobacteriales bacterium]